MMIAILGAESTGKTQLALALGVAHRIANTNALMTAIYRDVLFQDPSLYPPALAQHRHVDLTLVTGLDLPWVAEDLKISNPHLQAQVDARLRHVLITHELNFTVVYGVQQARADCALRVIAHLGSPSHQTRQALQVRPAWLWNCEKCSDPDCEHALFSALIK